MKGFFIFYSAVILLVFCLMYKESTNTGSLIILTSKDEYKVTISGAVDYPDTYVVSSDTFVFEVLNLAVLKNNAVTEGLDMYQFVENNMKIQIDYGIININTAGLDELCELTGVGSITAQKIIDYRSTTPFKSIEDLKNIGNAIYENNKDRITV